MTGGEFWEHVNALCGAFNGSVTSGWRSRKRNKRKGGSKKSYHLVGLGADVVLDDRADSAAFMAMAKRLGLWTLDEGDHIHLQPAKE